MKAQPESAKVSPTKVVRVTQIETPLDKLKKHAGTIMLVLTGIIVVVFVIRYRSQAAANRVSELASAMNVLHTEIPLILPTEASSGPAEQIVAQRNQLQSEIIAAIDTVNRNAGDAPNAATLRAEALVARGDLNWALANAPPLAAATTRPAMALPRKREDYLDSAERAYRDVLQAYPDQILSWATAQYGLAAIAENRGDWVKALEAYNAVSKNQRVPDSLRNIANLWISKLPELKTPLLIGPVGAAATKPSLPDLIAAPTSAPASKPTTMPDNKPTTIGS